VKQHVNTTLCLLGRKLPQAAYIGPVHTEDEVKPCEVLRRDKSRPLAGDIDAEAVRHGDRARIWRLPRMPAAERGRIDLEGIAETALRNHGTEDAFGKGRAADIPEADKQNRGAGLC